MRAFCILENEKGAILVIGLLILVLLTVLGLSTTTSTITYTHIAGNEKFYKLAFYSAEAATGYVAADTSLYDGDSITVGVKLYFPNNGSPSQEYTLDAAAGQTFRGEVEYQGWMTVPPDSGYEIGAYVAHRYVMTCYGYGPRDAQITTKMGFYRVGF